MTYKVVLICGKRSQVFMNDYPTLYILSAESKELCTEEGNAMWVAHNPYKAKNLSQYVCLGFGRVTLNPSTIKFILCKYPADPTQPVVLMNSLQLLHKKY